MIENACIRWLKRFQLIRNLKSDHVNSEKPKSQFAPQIKPPTEIKLASAAAPKLGTPTRVRLADPETRAAKPALKNTRTLEEADNDREEEVFQYKKLARSTPAVVHSPKVTKKLLNAYGVPLTAANTNQPKAATAKPTSDLADRIKVCVRKRPLSQKEIKRGDSDVAAISGRRTIGLMEPK